MTPFRKAAPAEPDSRHGWSLVAFLALGSLFWLPRFQERLPGGPSACPRGAAEPFAPAGEAPEIGRAAKLHGALGEARVQILPTGVLLEREESPEVRWVLSPLAFVVGLSLAGLAAARFRLRLRRPKAALVYAASALLGLSLGFAAIRAATYSQTIRLAPGSVAFDTAELAGLWSTRRTVSGVVRVDAWKSMGRLSLVAVPARRADAGCAAILNARWIEPDLLAVLNKALQ
ncbi:MAG: hypothetical protein HY925_05780 [Elusimicrobia bacterium]|nr:hypothetical protein [Elusimicrobiota bacterium]